MKVMWLRRAERSLEGLADFIARDNPRAAFEMVMRLREAAAALARAPEMGRPGRVKGTRELVVPGTPYILPYRVTRDSIHILHVLRGARRWPRNL
jgi:toxin ParE1/3/4